MGVNICVGIVKKSMKHAISTRQSYAHILDFNYKRRQHARSPHLHKIEFYKFLTSIPRNSRRKKYSLRYFRLLIYRK
jgi:hypothetical protein